MFQHQTNRRINPWTYKSSYDDVINIKSNMLELLWPIKNSCKDYINHLWILDMYYKLM